MNEPAYKKVEEGWKRKMSLPPLRMPINTGVLRDWWKMEENFKKKVGMKQLLSLYINLLAINYIQSFLQGTESLALKVVDSFAVYPFFFVI